MIVLDPRPEPPGAKLTIERDDPLFVVLKVWLPGFTLDNITVAMRRGHRVHIVADSYGESGGASRYSNHF
jgi:HSP20 family molecular chaperone IbpA